MVQEIVNVKNIEDIFTKLELKNLEPFIIGCARYIITKDDWKSSYGQQFKYGLKNWKDCLLKFDELKMRMGDNFKSLLTHQLQEDFTFIEIQNIGYFRLKILSIDQKK